jgi:hypothetical protein
VVVRPSLARLRRTFAVAAPGVALGVVGVAADGTNVIGPWALLVAVTTLVLWAAPVSAFLVLQFRNERLFGRGQDLVYIDWRGRSRVVPRAQISGVGLVTIVTGGSPQRRKTDHHPVLRNASIRDQSWHVGRRLSPPPVAGTRARRARGRSAAYATPTPHSLPRHADSGTPERHPWLFGLAATAVILVATVVVIAMVIGIAGG